MLAEWRYWAKIKVKNFKPDCVFVKVMVSTAKCINCLPIISNYHASTIKYSISHIICIRLMVLWVIMLTLKSVYILLGMQLLPSHRMLKRWEPCFLFPLVYVLFIFQQFPSLFPFSSFPHLLSLPLLCIFKILFQKTKKPLFLILPFLYQTCLPQLGHLPSPSPLAWSQRTRFDPVSSLLLASSPPF